MRVMYEILDSQAFGEFCCVSISDGVPDGHTIPTYRMTREQVKRVIFRYIFEYCNTLRVNSFNPDELPPIVYRLGRTDSVRAA